MTTQIVDEDVSILLTHTRTPNQWFLFLFHSFIYLIYLGIRRHGGIPAVTSRVTVGAAF